MVLIVSSSALRHAMCGTNRGFSAARRLAIDANEKQERVAVQLLQVLGLPMLAACDICE